MSRGLWAPTSFWITTCQFILNYVCVLTGPAFSLKVKESQQKPQQESFRKLFQEPFPQLQQEPLPQPPSVAIASPLQQIRHTAAPPRLWPQGRSARPGRRTTSRPCSSAWDSSAWQRPCSPCSTPSALRGAATCQCLPTKLCGLWADGAKPLGGNVPAAACCPC